MTSLTTCLEKFKGNYNALNTQEGGYLRFQAGSWNLSRLSIKSSDQKVVLEEITSQLCEENLKQLPHPESFISRINEVFTNIKEYLKALSRKAPEEKICFHSQVEEFEYFSNFFPTLIVNSKGRVYPSAEVYYQSQIINVLVAKDPSLQKELPKIPDPLKWKKAGERILQSYLEKHPEDSEEINQLKIKGMQAVIERKFNQNPSLKKLLEETNECLIAESSSTDRFFGTDELGIGENHLGKILMELRSAYNLPKKLDSIALN